MELVKPHHQFLWCPLVSTVLGKWAWTHSGSEGSDPSVRVSNDLGPPRTAFRINEVGERINFGAVEFVAAVEEAMLVPSKGGQADVAPLVAADTWLNPSRQS